MIQYINKDVTTVDRGIVAHGVNCQHAMGSGVAKAIKEKWPQVYDFYMGAPMGKVMLGNVLLVDIDPGADRLFVANCYTQLFYGHGGGKYADIDSVDQALQRVCAYANYYDLPVYMPRIGCGLGGLDWDKDVGPIIEALAELNDRIDIFVCDL